MLRFCYLHSLKCREVSSCDVLMEGLIKRSLKLSKVLRIWLWHPDFPQVVRPLKRNFHILENRSEDHRLEKIKRLLYLYVQIGNICIYMFVVYTLHSRLRWSMKTWYRLARTDVNFHFRPFCERDGAGFVHLVTDILQTGSSQEAPMARRGPAVFRLWDYVFWQRALAEMD